MQSCMRPASFSRQNSSVFLAHSNAAAVPMEGISVIGSDFTRAVGKTANHQNSKCRFWKAIQDSQFDWFDFATLFRAFRDEESFRRLYEERLPAYALADYRVDSNTEPSRVVEQILALGIFPKVTA